MEESDFRAWTLSIVLSHRDFNPRKILIPSLSGYFSSQECASHWGVDCNWRQRFHHGDLGPVGKKYINQIITHTHKHMYAYVSLQMEKVLDRRGIQYSKNN